MYWIIDIMKAVACLMILNFHSEPCFPEQLKIFAFGGDIGNNIFFLVSGFSLLPSIIKMETQFNKWYKKRFVRVFPLHFLFTVGSAFLLGYGFSVTDMIRAFIFPSIYWFTTAILLFYFILFIYERIQNNAVRWGGIAVLFILHLIFDSVYAEQYIMGLAAMMVGAEIRRLELSSALIKVKIWFHFAMIIMSFMCFMGLKMMYGKGISIYGLIHLMIGVSTIVFGVALLRFGIQYHNVIMIWLDKRSLFKKLVKSLSSAALATYLITIFDDYYLVKTISKMGWFPLSYIINAGITIVLALFITWGDNYVRKTINIAG